MSLMKRLIPIKIRSSWLNYKFIYKESMVKDDKGLQYYEAVGRRKSAVARVRLYILGKNKLANVNGLKIKPGEIFVNDKLISDYFSSRLIEIFICYP